MGRIELSDSLSSAIIKMAGGNPGAISVCTRALTEGGEIDPDSAFGGIGVLLSLDTHSIYEHRIWMLYRDVCGQDLVALCGVLRGVQLGIVPEQVVQHAIDHMGEGLDVPGVLAGVRKELPAFGVAVAEKED